MACEKLPPTHTIHSPDFGQFLQDYILMAPYTRPSSTRKTRQNKSEPIEASTPVLLRHEKYQDALHVNSIESEEVPVTTGVKHYLHMHHHQGLSSKRSLDLIDYAALARLHSSATPALAMISPPLPPPPPLPRAPLAPSPPTAYTSAIYTGTTHNPAVFLAILHLAQRNLPHIDLVSALNHIPNISPTDALPVLCPRAVTTGSDRPIALPFLDAYPPRPKRDGDADVNIAFLPHFYDNGTRHALGFFQIEKCPRRGRMLSTAFFTPCSEEELRRYGLVEYEDVDDEQDIDEEQEGEEEENAGVERMRRVGCEQGEWMEMDTVEDYDEWKLVHKVVSSAWEIRMGAIRGS